jgi:hypothetical protein
MDALKLTERHLEQKASEILEDARRLRTPLAVLFEAGLPVQEVVALLDTGLTACRIPARGSG